MPQENEDHRAPPVPASGNTKKTPRRNFLQFGLILGIVMVGAGIASVVRSLFSPAEVPPAAVTPTVTVTSVGTPTGSQTSAVGIVTSSGPFPIINVANISDMAGGATVEFNYPLQETPNLLMKLGVKAVNGVGPDGDIVAFSQICQHLGCIWGFVAKGKSPGCDSSYEATEPVGYCCCHGSEYELANGGEVIGGPAPRPVPQVILVYDDSTGDIYATGMAPPTIFGYHTGSDNVLYDLQGGTLVS